MHDHEGLARSHARRDQALTDRLAVALEHAKAQALIARAQAHRAHQVELAADLMAHAVADLVAIGDLVAQQAIGALTGMAQHPGNAGEPAHRRRRKDALRADGEDDGRVIVLIGPLREGLALHPPRRQAASRQRVGAGLHPRRMEADDAVHLRQMRRQRRHRRRGQQRQLSLRQRLAHRRERRRRHQHVAEVVQPDQQDAARLAPSGDTFSLDIGDRHRHPWPPELASGMATTSA